MSEIISGREILSGFASPEPESFLFLAVIPRLYEGTARIGRRVFQSLLAGSPAETPV